MTINIRHCERFLRSNLELILIFVIASALCEAILILKPMKFGGYIYILTNKSNSTLYVGVTSDLQKRLFEHINKIYLTSFTSKYNMNKLVYFEGFNRIEEAIAREKQLKGGSRKKKIELINRTNPHWKDLVDEFDE